MPEPEDTMLRVGTLERNGRTATLRAELGKVFETFEVDRVVLTRAEKDPTEAGVLFGGPGLFQRLHTRARLGRLPAPEGASRSLLAALEPRPAYADVVFPWR